MEKRLFGLFSGGHIAATVCVAMLVPGGLFAAVTFSNVAVVNPNTGTAAFVDPAGRVSVLDSIGSYRNYPSDMVEIQVFPNLDACVTTQQYAVPAGKAFILTGMSGFLQQFDTSTNYSGVAVYAGAGCSGRNLTSFITASASGLRFAPVVAHYGSGIPVPAGSTISVQSLNDYGAVGLHGYLVPAAIVAESSLTGSAGAGAPAPVAGKLPGMTP